MVRALERALDRLAAATGIRRVKSLEKQRLDHNGDPAARRRAEEERAKDIKERAHRLLP